MTATVFPAYGLARMVVPKWYALGSGRRLGRRPRARVLADPRGGAARVPDLDDRALADRARPRAADLGPRRRRVRHLGRRRARRERSSRFSSPCWRSGSSGSPGSPSPCEAGVPSGRRGTGSVRSRWSSASPSQLAAAMGHASTAWRNTMLIFKDRIFEHASWAFGALAIGIGVLPVLLGVAALVRPRAEERDPRTRAFVTTSVAALIVFVAYAGVKGAVQLDGLLHARRRAQPHLPLPDPVRRDGARLRPRCRTWLGDRGRRDLHALRRHRCAAPPRSVPVLRGARPLDRGVRESRVRVVGRTHRGGARRCVRRGARRRRRAEASPPTSVGFAWVAGAAAVAVVAWSMTGQVYAAEGERALLGANRPQPAAAPTTGSKRRPAVARWSSSASRSRTRRESG